MLTQLISTLSSLGAASGLHHVDRDDPRLAQLADFARELSKLAKVSDGELEAACRAHWPSWDRMRPDNARAWRAKIHAALTAAALARRP